MARDYTEQLQSFITFCKKRQTRLYRASGVGIKSFIFSNFCQILVCYEFRTGNSSSTYGERWGRTAHVLFADRNVGQEIRAGVAVRTRRPRKFRYCWAN